MYRLYSKIQKNKKKRTLANKLDSHHTKPLIFPILQILQNECESMALTVSAVTEQDNKHYPLHIFSTR